MKQTPESVWGSCLDFIKDNINEQSYKTWFQPIKPLKLSESALTIQVPSKFFYEWLEEHYIELLKSSIRRELGQEAKLVYSIVMENTYGNNKPVTVKIPSSNRPPIKNPDVSAPLELIGSGLKNPFIIPGLKKVNVCLLYTSPSPRDA